MSKSVTVILETAFASYNLGKPIGEGGAGRVYEARNEEQIVAIKILPKDKSTNDRLKRFKNEIEFLRKTSHRNVVSLLDVGRSNVPGFEGPFYVMPRHSGSLRDKLKTKIAPADAMKWFSGMLDGVECAHLLHSVHRDLKPENFLCDADPSSIKVSDFGIASFKVEELWTAVETGPNQKLGNFAYAAPEQRDRGAAVGIPADIFALGLMLNEMFTGEVPYGEEYKKIASVSPELVHLDRVVAEMLRRDPSSRPASIDAVKTLLLRYEDEAISRQKLEKLSKIVIPEGQNPDPLAHIPPKITNVDWKNGNLTLFFDQVLSRGFIDGLYGMGSYQSLMGKHPQNFSFQGNQATIDARDNEVQPIVDLFKIWLPKATATYNLQWKANFERVKYQQEQQLKQEREAEERRLKLLGNIKF